MNLICFKWPRKASRKTSTSTRGTQSEPIDVDLGMGSSNSQLSNPATESQEVIAMPDPGTSSDLRPSISHSPNLTSSSRVALATSNVDAATGLDSISSNSYLLDLARGSRAAMETPNVPPATIPESSNQHASSLMIGSQAANEDIQGLSGELEGLSMLPLNNDFPSFSLFPLLPAELRIKIW